MADSLHPKTREIFTWAKRSATAARRSTLAIPDLLCGLYALDKAGHLIDEIKAIVGDSGRWEWPPEVVEGYQAAEGVPPDVAEKQFFFDNQLRGIVDTAFLNDRGLRPEVLLTAVKGWRANQVAAHAPDTPAGAKPAEQATESMVARLGRFVDSAMAIESHLGSLVLGQDSAVSMVAEGYLHSVLSATGSGPRGLFTLLGPPGVGKTLLAESFAQALSKSESTPHPFRRFDMGGFGGPQNFEQLLGAEQFYKGARPGTLTGFVNENPKAVILFDEIEKAHDNTLQALLAILDRGEVADKALEKVVSFKDAWLFFTTNLGRELFDRRNETGFLSRGTISSAAVFDLLASARSRRNVGDRDAAPALSPEFVSRLAKGNAALFSRLDTHHYMRLIDASLLAGAAQPGRGVPAVSVEDDAKLLFLMSLLPDVDARRVVARSQAWTSEIVHRSFGECRASLVERKIESFDVRVECGPAARAWVEAEAAAFDTRILFVDDAEDFPPLIKRDCPDLRLVIRQAGLDADVLVELQQFPADLVILDLNIGEGPNSSQVDKALGILERLRHALPALPVYLFSENPEARGHEAFMNTVGLVLRRGGARGFIPCRRAPDNPVLIGDFVAQVREAIEEARYSSVMRRKERTRKHVSFEIRYAWNDARKCVVGEIRDPFEEVVVGAADRAGTIQFAGVPQERLSDVAGLDRAKRRITQVVGWLRNPSALGVFGVRPPTGFLLVGPPGTGKTLLARALAGEAEMPFLAVSPGDLKTKWLGGSEERVREVFAMARRYAPSIVFIDEIDTLGGSRDSAEGSWNASILNELLACMDGFSKTDRPVFVLGATNRPEALDPALRRPGRFDETIPIDLPNARARQQFFDRRLAGLKFDTAPDLVSLVSGTSGCTPADLDRIVREAVYAAAATNRTSLTAADLEQARRLVRFGAEHRDMVLREDERRVTAYHEGSHALLHATLRPDRPIDFITIVPTETGALGFVAPGRDESRHDLTREDVRAEIAMLLAGREGELIATGGRAEAVTASASSDLQKATSLAYRAVTEWAFDDEFGLVSVAGLPERVRHAADDRLQPCLSRWLTEGRDTARRVLNEHRTTLDAIARALLEEDSMDGGQLNRIVEG